MRGMEGNEGAGGDLNRSGNGGERRHMAVLMDERGVEDDVESEEAAAPANGGERGLDGKVVKGGFGERKIALRAFLSIGGGNIGPWDFKEVGVMVTSIEGRRREGWRGRGRCAAATAGGAKAAGVGVPGDVAEGCVAFRPGG